jgi:hypothetical protein
MKFVADRALSLLLLLEDTLFLFFRANDLEEGILMAKMF